MTNRLFYGDNLDVLREHVASESVDLVYLDPPFNSNRNYNVLFGKHVTAGASDAAQIQAFDDTWTWTPTTGQQFNALVGGGLPNTVADALTAMRTLLTENDAMAYLVNMAPRLVELHRVLKPSGSLYLHCDPTMSHYLKVLVDSIFGPRCFTNEVIWKRSTAHSDAKQGSKHLGRLHDVLLFYVKTPESHTFTPIMLPYDEAYVAAKYPHTEDGTGRRYGLWDMTGPGGAAKGNPSYEVLGVTRYWRYSEERMQRLLAEGRVVQPRPGGVPRFKRYLDESPGVPLQDVWTDVDPINSQAAERLGYPTQKPLRLMERIIQQSSDEDAVVLDPFCGCGTTIDAALRLSRRWIGIDVTYIAIDLIEKRLRHTHGDAITHTYEVHGIPRDLGGAQALFDRSPFDFERWAVSLIDAQPNEKQVGDKGVDGVARFPLDAKGATGRILVSVKGGKAIGPQFARDLLGTIETQRAEMGVLITMTEPTRGVLDAVNHGGTYSLPATGQQFPRVQVVTIAQLLQGERPRMPLTLLPYIAAKRRQATSAQLTLDPD